MTQTQPWTVQRLLEWTRGFLERKNVDGPRLATEALLSHVLGVPRIKLYTDYNRELSDAQLADFRALVKRAGEEEPIAYLTGLAPFFNLEFNVTRDTLIPRPDTETLVEQTLAIVERTTGWEAPRVLDLCTGSGCVAAAIAQHIAAATVVAIDLSPTAVRVAKANVERLKLSDRVTVLEGDLFEPISQLPDPRPFEIIVANPPYIASDVLPTLDRSVKDYEPHLALDGGPDGLRVHRRILASAAERLVDDGVVYLEIAYDQQEAALSLAAEFDDFDNARVLRDHAGKPRVLAVKKRTQKSE